MKLIYVLSSLLSVSLIFSFCCQPTNKKVKINSSDASVNIGNLQANNSQKNPLKLGGTDGNEPHAYAETLLIKDDGTVVVLKPFKLKNALKMKKHD